MQTVATVTGSQQTIASFWLPLCGFLVAAGALFVQRQRARIMSEQLETQKKQIAELERTRSLQELRSFVKELLDIRTALETVLTLEGKDASTWSHEETQAAHTVCARFHLIGILILEKMVPEDLFAKALYYSVPRCYEILTPFLRTMRSERDPRYWSAFDVLEEIVKENTRNFGGFKKPAKPESSRLETP
jgi:hypothetical protein